MWDWLADVARCMGIGRPLGLNCRAWGGDVWSACGCKKMGRQMVLVCASSTAGESRRTHLSYADLLAVEQGIYRVGVCTRPTGSTLSFKAGAKPGRTWRAIDHDPGRRS